MTSGIPKPSTPDWAPFFVDSTVRVAPRPISSAGFAGIGDRLRTAAFAELQAEFAFLWASEAFLDAPAELREDWKHLAREERKHRFWLLDRMQALGVDLRERPVSDSLWHSLSACKTAKDFCHYMADAEMRGRRAGERFAQALMGADPESAKIFGQIAHEEIAHIELAYRFFPRRSD